MLLDGCGSKATDTDSASAKSWVDTSGPNINMGSLNSLSGTIATSEGTVRDAIKLAVEEINGAGVGGRRRGGGGHLTESEKSLPLLANPLACWGNENNLAFSSRIR